MVERRRRELRFESCESARQAQVQRDRNALIAHVTEKCGTIEYEYPLRVVNTLHFQ